MRVHRGRRRGGLEVAVAATALLVLVTSFVGVSARPIPTQLLSKGMQTVKGRTALLLAACSSAKERLAMVLPHRQHDAAATPPAQQDKGIRPKLQSPSGSDGDAAAKREVRSLGFSAAQAFPIIVPLSTATASVKRISQRIAGQYPEQSAAIVQVHQDFVIGLSNITAEANSRLDAALGHALGMMPGGASRKWRSRTLPGHSLHKQVYSAAPFKVVVKACGDFTAYPQWAGSGLKEVTLVKQTPKQSIVHYKAGALGLNFDFTLEWTRQTLRGSVPYVLTFRNVDHPGSGKGLIGSLQGAYLIDEKKGSSVIDFDFAADLDSRVPALVKSALGKMVCDIATQDLSKFAEKQTVAPRAGGVVKEHKLDRLEERRKKAKLLAKREGVRARRSVGNVGMTACLF